MSNWNDTREAYRDAKDMERRSILGDDELPCSMSEEEHREYLCSLLFKLIDSNLTVLELTDLASALGIRIAEFYPEPKKQVLNVIDYGRKAA